MNTWRTSLVALLLSVALPVWGGTIVSTYGDTVDLGWIHRRGPPCQPTEADRPDARRVRPMAVVSAARV